MCDVENSGGHRENYFFWLDPCIWIFGTVESNGQDDEFENVNSSLAESGRVGIFTFFTSPLFYVFLLYFAFISLVPRGRNLFLVFYFLFCFLLLR